MDQPCLIMFIGLPGSGKSTIARDFHKLYPDYVRVSLDDYIENAAKVAGKTYSDIFAETATQATQAMYADAQDAINLGKSVIWDQTNLTKKNRQAKFEMFPPEYKKVGIWVKCSDSFEWGYRIGNRPGKVIPPEVLDQMMNRFEEPHKDEGFDQLSTYDTAEHFEVDIPQ